MAAVAQVDRFELQQELGKAIGVPAAAKLMSQLPGDLTEFATKTDVTNLGIELRGEMKSLQAEMKGVQAEMTAMESRIDGKFAGIEGRLSDLAGEVKNMGARMERQFASYLNRMTYMLIGFTVAIFLAIRFAPAG